MEGWRLSSTTRSRFVLMAVLGGVLILGVFLLVTGGWTQLQRLLLYVGIKKREVALSKIDAERQAWAKETASDAARLRDLEAKRRALEKENAADGLRIDGMTHDQVVVELAKRGF